MKTTSVLIVILSILTIPIGFSQVGINTDGSSSDSSAMLDVKSTDKGMLIPRMSRNKKDAIQSPAEGLLVYQTDYAPGFFYFDGIRWQRIQDQRLSISDKGAILDSCILIPVVDVDNMQGGGFAAGTMYWQGFQAKRTANLIGVQLDIATGRELNGYLNIYSGEGISGALLLRLEIDNERLSPKMFDSISVPITEDSFYTIQIVDTLDVVSWAFPGGNSYPPSISSAGINRDYNFRTFVDSCGQISIIDRHGDGISLNQIDTLHFSDGTFLVTNQDNDFDPNNEIQLLSIDNQALTIGGGNTVMIPNNADNLGNHIASTNIQLGNQYISKDGDNEGIRIDDSGNVGIGTATPSELLHVNGNFRASGISLLKGIFFPAAFEVDNNFVGSTGNSLAFGHVNVSEDFIGYRSNTFYFKDSPGGGDSLDPNIETGGQIRAGQFVGNGSLLTGLTLRDLDNDTKIQVEASPDEDTIRIDIAGTEFIKLDGKTFGLNSPGESLLIGHRAGSKDDGQFRGNTYVGFRSGEIDTSGQWNTGLGGLSLINNKSGSKNTAIGRESMVANNNGLDNTAVGYVSLRMNSEGKNNTAVGSKALVINSLGNDNTAVGTDALFNNEAGNFNTALGANSLIGNTGGSQNTAIGYQADVTIDSLRNATAIGANAKVSQDSSLILGNAANIGIGTSAPDARLHIVGDFKMVDGTQGNGKIMVSDSAGRSSWKDALEAIPLPDTAKIIPIIYHGNYLYVHPVDNADSISWQAAVDTCNNLTAFGFADWYLPTRLELDAMYKQSYLITGLSQTSMAKYWSATALEGDPTIAFTQRLDFGGPDPDPKTDVTDHNCRCIRKN